MNCAASVPGHGGAGAAQSRLEAAPGPDLVPGRNGKAGCLGSMQWDAVQHSSEGLDGSGQESPTPGLPTVLLGTGLRSR